MILELTTLLLLAYAWAGYPVLLFLFDRLRRELAACETAGAAPAQPAHPTAAVLFSARNEASVILKRLENLGTAPVMVGLDGCTDSTAGIAHDYAATHPNVRVFEFKENRGKIAVLKDLVAAAVRSPSPAASPAAADVNPALTGGLRGANHSPCFAQGATQNKQSSVHNSPSCRSEPVKKLDADGPRHADPPGNNRIHWASSAQGGTACRRPQLPHSFSVLVFTDANTVFAPDALERLLARFSDPRVGGVCGRLVFTAASSGQRLSVPPEGFYWRMENRLKERESLLDSCLGANGAIYAVRSELFPLDVPDNTIVDDFVIGMRIREGGRKMVYEPGAVAYEDQPATVAGEWRRRVRIGAGDFQALSLCRRCLLPRYGVFAWIFWSHKVLRWITPHLLLALALTAACRRMTADPALPTSAALFAGEILDWIVVGSMLAFMYLAVAGRFSRDSVSALSRLPRLCDYFLTMQAALFAGFLRFCRGGLAGRWERTERG